MKKVMPLRNWLPLMGLTLSAFVFNTSEFMPIGLLTDIAGDLNITEAHAGLLISVYAWCVALLSLPLMLLFSRVEYRKLLLCTVALFIASHVLSSVATGYMGLMVSRIGVACAHSVFWSIASPLAVSVVPERCRHLALCMIVTGTCIAMIVGLPLGRIVGLFIGWRMAFLCVAAAALLIWLLLLFVFPRVPAPGGISLRNLPLLLNRPVLISIYLLTFLIVTAHYTAYSYIEPFLEQAAGLRDQGITLALTLFGVFGICGSVLFSRFYDKSPGRFLNTTTFGLALLLMLLQAASGTPVTTILLCIFWGMAATAFSISLQSEIIRNAQQGTTAIAMSIFSGIFNLGIGCGALAGGAVCTWFAVNDIGYAGGVIALCAALYGMTRLLRLLRCAPRDTAPQNRN